MRGFTLVESMVSLCVGSLVAAMALTSLSAGGLLVRHLALASRDEDRAWLALAAIAADFEANASWRTCAEARDCPHKHVARTYRVPVFLAGGIGWLAQDGLRRCDVDCQVVEASVRRLDVVADMGAGGLVYRQPFIPWHGRRSRALAFTVTLADGRRFTRIVARSPP